LYFFTESATAFSSDLFTVSFNVTPLTSIEVSSPSDKVTFLASSVIAVSFSSIIVSTVEISATPFASVTSNVNSVSNIRLAASIALLANCPCIYVFKVAPLDGSYAFIKSNKPRLPISISL